MAFIKLTDTGSGVGASVQLILYEIPKFFLQINICPRDGVAPQQVCSLVLRISYSL